MPVIEMNALENRAVLHRAICILIQALLLLVTVYAILLIVYRLTWHPLAGFPGPKLAAMTKWYECFYDTCKGEGGQYTWKVQQMHRRFGPVVRVNPDEIHIQDPSYLEQIYPPLPARRDKYGPAAALMFCPLGSKLDGLVVHTAAIRCQARQPLRPTAFNRTASMGILTGSTAFGTVKHDIHRKRRLANSPLFSSRALQSAHKLIYERTSILCQNLKRVAHDGDVLHVHSTLLSFTTDVISSYMLGRPFGCQNSANLTHNWYRTMRSLKQLIPLVKQFPWVLSIATKLPPWLVQSANPKLGLVLGMYWDMHEESRLHASNRTMPLENFEKLPSLNTKPEGTRMTIFETIDKSNLPLREKDIARQAQEAFVLISAGTETAAGTISTLLYHLAANPEVLAKLRVSLHKAMPSGNEQPEVAVLESLHYLTAVIKETLRVQRLMTSRFPLVAPDDLQYQGWTIPAGTPVSMTISEVLLDAIIFPQPHAFKPERWLDVDEDSGAYILHDRLDRFFVPFGRGTRMCQGKEFAWAEMYICVSQLIRKFGFELYDTIYERDVAVSRDCFLGTTSETSLGVRMKVECIVAA